MKKQIWIAVGIAAAGFAGAAPVSLNNPSFESGTGGYWINRPANAHIDSSESSDGAKSLAVAPADGKRVNVVFNKPTRPGAVYQLSFDARTDVPQDGPKLTFAVMLQEAKPIAFYKGTAVQRKAYKASAPLTGEWRTFTYEIGPVPAREMNKEVRRLMFYINVDSGEKPGKVWLDNIRLTLEKEGEAAPETTQGESEAAVIEIAKPIRIFEEPAEVKIKGETGLTLCATVTDAFGNKVLEKKGSGEFQLRLSEPDYYEIAVEALRNGKKVAERRTSLAVTTPLPLDYYSTPHPAFGVWGGLSPELRRLGGAKWDRQLFFTAFQKKDAKALPPSPEKIAAREPVKIIRCLNILHPFKRMTGVPASEFAKIEAQLEKEIVSKRGMVDVWESQNEPMVGENFHGTMADVMAIQKLESGAVRRHDPGRPFAGICINPMSENQYRQYVGYYKNFDAARHLDAVMLHPYIPGAQNPDASGYVETLNRLQRELKALAGRPVPMYISEIGYSTKPGGEVTELQQAAYLARVAILNRTIENLQACVWHIGLWNEATSRRELDFGLLRKYAKNSPVREPKPAFAAWATVSRMTWDAKLVRELNVNRKIRVWLFEKAGKPMLIAYSLLPEPVEFELVLNAPEARVTTVCGKSETVKLKDGVLHWKLTEAPVYIAGGNMADFDEARYSATFTPAAPAAAPGTACEMAIHLPEALAKAGGTLRLTSKLAIADVKSTGSGAARQVKFTVPAGTEPGEYEVFFRLEDKGSCRYIWQKTVNVLPPVALENPRPATGTGDDPAIAFEVKKNDPALRGSCVAEIRENDRVVGLARLPETGSGKITLYQVKQGRPHQYSAKLTMADGTGWTQALPSDLVPVVIPECRNALAMPVEKWPTAGRYNLADGEYSRHGLKGEYDRPAGEIRLAYDAQKLYMAIRVRDRYEMMRKGGAGMWDGDSLQIGIRVPQASMIRPNNDGIQETGYAEIGVKAGGEKPDSHVWASMNLEEMPLHGPVPGMENRSERRGEMTEYRIAIPWRTLNIRPERRMKLGVSVLVNDRDPAGRHWLEWFGGIADGKTPSAYGSAVLR